MSFQKIWAAVDKTTRRMYVIDDKAGFSVAPLTTEIEDLERNKEECWSAACASAFRIHMSTLSTILPVVDTYIRHTIDTINKESKSDAKHKKIPTKLMWINQT